MKIKANLYSVTELGDRLSHLIKLLEQQPLLSPTGFEQEPPRGKKFPPQDASIFEAAWNQHGHLKFFSESPYYWFQIVRQLWFRKNKLPDWLNLGIEASFFGVEGHTTYFLDFAKDLFLWSESVYGYVSHEKDYNRQNEFPQITRVHGKLLSYLGTDIRGGLPGVYWANFFGRQYIEWFGVDKFKTVPCYELEELPNGGVVLLTAHSPLAFEEGREFEMSIKEHLGYDAFVNINDPEKPLRSPFLDGTIVLE